MGAEWQVRRVLGAGIGGTFVGLGIAATISPTAGGVMSVIGWGVTAYAVHRLGRLGG